MTPLSIITLARSIYNDADPVYYRLSNDELVSFVNDGLKECVNVAPKYFMEVGDFTCAVGKVEQEFTFSQAKEVLDVIRIKNGKAILPMDLMAISAFNPDWASDTAGAVQNWSRFASDPLRFYIYPKAPATAQVLEVLYTRNPLTYTLNDVITEVPETIAPALAWYVIYMAEMRDDEHVNSGRGVAAYKQFVNSLKGEPPTNEPS